MREFEIRSLENGSVLGAVFADGFNVSDQNGIITFYKKDPEYPAGSKTVSTGVMQISAVLVVSEKQTGKPEVVQMPAIALPEGPGVPVRLTDSTARAWPEGMGR